MYLQWHLSQLLGIVTMEVDANARTSKGYISSYREEENDERRA